MEKKLIKLMNENPDIPVIPMVNSKVCAGAEGYWMGIIGQCELSECVMLEMNDETRICFKDDLEEIKDYFHQQYLNREDLTLEEKQSKCLEKIESLLWEKVIIVHIELPNQD